MYAQEQLVRQFASRCERPPRVIVRSPGRVNLIGEHTDYNEGFVLPAALDLATWIAAAPRADGRLHTVTVCLREVDEVPLADLRPGEGPVWTRYVRGMAALLQEAGCVLPGADLLIDGDLPLSGGLSSSASLELGVGVALTALAGRELPRRELALLAQRVEHEVVGVMCGIMDQFAVAFGRAGHALLIDCRSLEVEAVPLPDDVRILVLDSAVPRMLAGSAYNERRAECEEAVRWLQVTRPEVRALRDATPEMLMEAVLHGCPAEDPQGRRGGAFQPDAILRRARHVVSEDQRVLDSIAALRSGDVARFGRLMAASHESLRQDFAVSGPELDALVDIAGSTPGVLGARLTGAGFGGACVALVATALAETVAASIVERYSEHTGHAGRAYLCTPAQGVHVAE